MAKTWRVAAALALGVVGIVGGAALLAESRTAPTVYQNPVLAHSFPDPSVLRVGRTYYAYATNTPGGGAVHLQCARSADLVHWTNLPDALPTLPAWANPGRTWAPEVREFGSGGGAGKRYVAYYCAWSKLSNAQAVGVAVSPTPAGPFVPAGDAPLVDQREEGGAIDPSCFVDTDGARYLTWKNDGNSRGRDCWLWVQRLSSDGLRLIGDPARLIKQDRPWEGAVVEGPTLWKQGGKYYLFYSASNFTTCDYAVGYAVAPAVFGPYVKPRPTPWLSSTPGVCGPGGEDIIEDGKGRPWMLYHSWEPGVNGGKRYRAMSLDPLVWNGDVPYLLGPSRWLQPAPRP